LRANPDAPLARLIGAALVRKPPLESTFDLHVRQLGHALFPWSAFMPFAIGRLFRAPQPSDESQPGEARRLGAREAAVRIYLLTGAAVLFAAYAFVAPYAGALPFA